MNRTDFATYIGCLKAHDFPGISRYYTPDIKARFGGSDWLTLDGIIAWEQDLAERADWTMNVLTVIMDEGGIAAELTIDLRFRRDTDLPGMPPMKKGDTAHVHLCMLYKLRDGKICEIRDAMMPS